MLINHSNFDYIHNIDKDLFILDELKANKNAYKYYDLKIVLERLRGAVYSFVINKYELKHVYADIDFIQKYYGFPFFILAEVQKIIKETYGVEFEILHKEELVETDNFFEFEFANTNNKNLIKPTECGNDMKYNINMTEQEIQEAMENSYYEELMAESYKETEEEYQVVDYLGNCSFKENEIYYED